MFDTYVIAKIPVSHDINSHLLMKKSHALILQFTRAHAVNTWLLLVLVTGRHTKHVSIMRN